LHGAVAVRAHRTQDAVRRQHEARLADWTAAMRGWVRLSLSMDAVQGLLCTALAGGLLLRHFAAHPQVGGADLLLVYWTLKLPALGQRLADLARLVPAQRNTLTRLMEPLSAPEDVPAAPAGPAAAPLLRPVGAPAGLRLRIDGGRVVAGGHTLLDDVTLDIAAGEQVAIVGASGAGKSTLLALLLGWHRLAVGDLWIDGRPADPAAVAALRRQVAWVDPAVQVWNHSLLDNLLYATPPGAEADADLAAVIDAARLRGVVQRLPQGLQGLLGEGGTRLSGGEGQRVRLGRALLAPQTRLVLLDEPFRGLDRGQRHALLAEARDWWQGRTLLCVTHDVGETTAFDRVLVVDGGRIVEDDTPARLAAGDTRYRALLDAEQQVRQVLWQGADWRRLTLQDGRLHEDSGEARPHGLPSTRLREAGR
jgi:ABC-type transport system involved in cytochrome bd biosynthesis fused ATPase/permease subunit